MSITSAILVIFLMLALANFNINQKLDSEFVKSLSYNFALWYLYAISFALWVCIGIYFKKMIASKSTSLLSLVLLTVAINLTLLIGFLIPQTLFYSKIHSHTSSVMDLIDIVLSSSGGIFMYIIMLSSRKRLRFMKSILQQYRKSVRRSKSKMIREPNDTRNSLDFVLLEVNDSGNSFSDGGLLAELFDNITKEVFEN